MKAFSVLETDEYTGGIIFAETEIAARRNGAHIWNNGELGGMEVHRRPDLDKFEATGVPASLLVDQGWHFECAGCGTCIRDYTLEDDGLRVDGVVGVESGRVFCCHACRMRSLAAEAGCKAFGEAFLEMLRDMVRARFPGIEHEFGAHHSHAFVPRWTSPHVVTHAHVYFSFPGMRHGPASLHYRHEGRNGLGLVGPVRPEFMCCNGDREAFEALAAEEFGE